MSWQERLFPPGHLVDRAVTLPERLGRLSSMQRPVIETMRSIDLAKGRYTLFGGAAMAMHGLRRASDVDVLVDPDYFYDLAKETPQGWHRDFVAQWPSANFIAFHTNREGQRNPDVRPVEIHAVLSTTPTGDFARNLAESVNIAGITVLSLDRLRQIKRDDMHPHRRKDQRDAILIDRNIEPKKVLVRAR